MILTLNYEAKQCDNDLHRKVAATGKAVKYVCHQMRLSRCNELMTKATSVSLIVLTLSLYYIIYWPKKSPLVQCAVAAYNHLYSTTLTKSVYHSIVDLFVFICVYFVCFCFILHSTVG